jgi:hypothetical protein
MVVQIKKKRKQIPPFNVHYYFTLIGDNGEPVAQSEQYTAKHNVLHTLRKYFPSYEVHDLTNDKEYRKYPPKVT